MATRIDQLFYTLDLQRQGFDKAMAAVQRELGKMGKSSGVAASQLVKLEGTMSRVGRTVKGATRFIGGFFGAFIGYRILRAAGQNLTEFQTAMAEVATIAEGGQAAVAGFRRQILSLTREVPQSPQELAAGLYQVLSAGITDSADAMKVLTASAKAAVAGLTDTKTAVDAVTTILNAFNKSADEATAVTDTLFTTVRLGKLRFDDVATSIGTAATSAALAGVSLNELTAAMATMTLAGIDSQEATSSLNRLFINLVNQTPKQAKAIKDMGVAFDTAAIAENGLAGVLAELNRLTDGQIDSLAKLFPNIRAAKSAFVLAGNSLERYQKVLELTNNSAGATETALSIMLDTAENQYQLVKNNLNAVWLDFGLKVLPIVTTAIRGWVEIFDLVKPAITRVREEYAKLIQETSAAGVSARGQQRLFERDLNAANVGIAKQQLLIKDLREQLKKTSSIEVKEALRGSIELATAELKKFEAQAKAAQEALQEIAPRLRVEGLTTDVDKFFDEFNQRIKQIQSVEVELRPQIEIGVRRQAIKDAEELIKNLKLEGDERKRVTAFIDEQKRALTILRHSSTEDDENIKKKGQLYEQLGRTIDSLTKTTAERQIETLNQLKDEYVKAGGVISAEMQKQFDAAMAAAQQALRQEQAAEFVKPFVDAWTQGLEEIELATVSIEDVETRRQAQLSAQKALGEDLLKQAQYLLDTGENTTEEEQALLDVIKLIKKALAGAADEQQKLGEDAKRDAAQRFRNLQHTLQLIQQSVDGTLELAKAFGIVDDEVAKTIRSLEQVGAGITTIIGAIKAGEGIGAIAAGGLGLLGGLAGLVGGESPEAAARRRIIEENTQALEDLRSSVRHLAGTFEISGQDFQRALEAVQKVPGLAVGGFGFGQADVIVLRRELARLGLTMGDLERIAKELGITIYDEAGNIIPASLNQLEDALTAIQTSLVGFPDTIEGTLQRLQIEFDLLDVSDPVDQLKRLQEELAKLGEAGEGVPAFEQLFGLDLTTAEGRAQAEALIEMLFRQLSSGAITPAALGAATFEEAVDILREMERLLDGIETDTTQQEGATQDVRRSVQITEAQGNAFLSELNTANFWNKEQTNVLHSIFDVLSGGITPVAPPATAASTITNNVDVVFENVDIQITGIENGQQAADVFLDEIDRKIGQRLLVQQRLSGYG